MFKIAERKSFTWPVTVNIPNDGGKFTKATFDAEFEALPQSEVERIVRDGLAGDGDASLAVRCLCGWKGVQDSDGSDLPYSEAAKEKLLEIPYVRTAVMDAYLTAAMGGQRRKN